MAFFSNDSDFFGRVKQADGLASPVAIPESSLVPPRDDGVGVGGALGSVFDAVRTRNVPEGVESDPPDPFANPGGQEVRQRSTREATGEGRTAPTQQTDFAQGRQASTMRGIADGTPPPGQGVRTAGPIGEPEGSKNFDFFESQKAARKKNMLGNLGGTLAGLFGGK